MNNQQLVRDKRCLDDISEDPNRAMVWMMAASYLYYCFHESLLSDETFDMLCKNLLERYDELPEHRHFQKLVTKEDLKAGTLYTVKEEEYPMILKTVAWGLYDDKCIHKRRAGDELATS